MIANEYKKQPFINGLDYISYSHAPEKAPRLPLAALVSSSVNAS